MLNLKKGLRFKKFHGNVDSADYDDLDNFDYNYDFADDDEYRKIGSIRTLFKEFDRDYYKPIRTNDGFAGRRNNSIEYKSKGDRHENLSPEEYLNMIKPYLRDLISGHRPIDESNDDNDDDDDDDDNTDFAKWKIQLTMQNHCISAKNFEDTCTIYTKSEPVEIFMGSDTNDVIDRLFNTTLKRFQQGIKTSVEESEFTRESVGLLYYHFQKIYIRRAESYIISPDWIVSKKQQ